MSRAIESGMLQSNSLILAKAHGGEVPGLALMNRRARLPQLPVEASYKQASTAVCNSQEIAAIALSGRKK